MISINGVEWKIIPNYNGRYSVSNIGEVWSSFSNRMLTQENSHGYLRVTLWKDGKGEHFRVHRLVATAYLKNKENYTEVNHKDENKLNNKLSNLEWCTPKYNTNHGTCISRRSSSRTRKVVQMDLYGNIIKIWDSGVDAETSGYSRQHISSCCNGKRKTHGGYIWKKGDTIIDNC